MVCCNGSSTLSSSNQDVTVSYGLSGPSFGVIFQIKRCFPSFTYYPAYYPAGRTVVCAVMCPKEWYCLILYTLSNITLVVTLFLELYLYYRTLPLYWPYMQIYLHVRSSSFYEMFLSSSLTPANYSNVGYKLRIMIFSRNRYRVYMFGRIYLLKWELRAKVNAQYVGSGPYQGTSELDGRQGRRASSGAVRLVISTNDRFM